MTPRVLENTSWDAACIPTYIFTSPYNTPNGYHMWRTPPEMRHWYQHIHSSQYNQFVIVQSSCLIFARGRLSPEPVFRATGLPRNRTFRATGLSAQHLQGFGSPPNSPLRLRETPYGRSTHFPLSVQRYAGLFRPRQTSLPDSAMLCYVSFLTDPLLSQYPLQTSHTSS